MRVHNPVRAEIACFRHGDEAGAGRFLGVGGDGVLEIAEHDIDLMNEFRHLRAQLLDVRRHEVNHALELAAAVRAAARAPRSPAA